MSIETIKLLVEALMDFDYEKRIAAIEAGRQAIAEAEKQEPVADHFDCGTYTGNHIGKEVKHTHLDSDQPKVEQEPVAWRFRTGTFWNREVHWRYVLSLEGTEGLQGLEPLYTTPQPAQKPLTDEQIEKIANEYGAGGWICEFTRAIEAAHGITASEAEDSAKGEA